MSIKNKILTGVVRAEVSFARDNGMAVEREVALGLALADFLELPDDTMFVPAVEAANAQPTQMNDPASVARTREIAIAAGYGRPIQVGTA
jgi:hypothetical protein